MNLKKGLAVTALLFSLTVSACSIEISDITAPGAPAPGLTHVSSPFTATPPPIPSFHPQFANRLPNSGCDEYLPYAHSHFACASHIDWIP